MTDRDRKIRYKMYDSMPQALRSLLQDFVVNLSPEQPYSLWRQGESLSSIVAGAHSYFRACPHSTVSVYGYNHPEAKKERG